MLKGHIYSGRIASIGVCVLMLLQNHTAYCQTPRTTNGWFQLFQAKSDLTWSGSDQATSYKAAANGLTYWLFGDTILGTRNPATGGYNPGWSMVANTILTESNGILTSATATNPAIPNALNGDRYWPQGVFEANGYLYCQCSRVRQTNSGLGFIPFGAEFAKFQFQPGGRITLLGMISTPGTGIAEGVGTSAIQWIRDAVVHDGYIYIFGDAITGVPLSPKAAYVSRVTVAEVENTNSWRFWNGATWITNSSNSASILPDMPSSVRYYGGKWVMLYKPFAGFGDQVKAALASNPWGPYSSGQVIFQSPGGSTSNGVTTELHCYNTYSPQSHTTYPLSSGKLLVSIAWNGCDLFNDTAKDANLYKPRFYEIALPGVPPVYPPARLEMQRDGTNLILQWSEDNTLLESTNLAGSWITNFATSPYTSSFSSGQKFYRVKVR
jgi:hypothetical protein